MDFRAPPELRTSIEAWAAASGLTLSEATRRLVEMGLERRSKSVGKPSAKCTERARQIVAKAIDGLVDLRSAPAEEAAKRRPFSFKQNPTSRSAAIKSVVPTCDPTSIGISRGRN